MSSFSRAIFLVLSLAPFAVACAGADDDPANDDDAGDVDVGEAEVNSAGRIEPGQFKLYPKGSTPNPSCDVYSKLRLSNRSTGPRANLMEVVDGACSKRVDPNVRYYKLKLTGTPCGSRVFEGTYSQDGVGHSVKITDHRSRRCADRVPATIVLEETTNASLIGPITTTLYSFDSGK